MILKQVKHKLIRIPPFKEGNITAARAEIRFPDPSGKLVTCVHTAT